MKFSPRILTILLGAGVATARHIPRQNPITFSGYCDATCSNTIYTYPANQDFLQTANGTCYPFTTASPVESIETQFHFTSATLYATFFQSNDCSPSTDGGDVKVVSGTAQDGTCVSAPQGSFGSWSAETFR